MSVLSSRGRKARAYVSEFLRAKNTQTGGNMKRDKAAIYGMHTEISRNTHMNGELRTK